jgi:hypothetical protein
MNFRFLRVYFYGSSKVIDPMQSLNRRQYSSAFCLAFYLMNLVLPQSNRV